MQQLRRLFGGEFWSCEVLSRTSRLLGLLFLLWSIPLSAWGQLPRPVVAASQVDNLDGPAPVLRPLTVTSGFSIQQRLVDRDRFEHGQGAERILLRGPAGQTLPLGYALQPAPVIAELHFRARVFSNRAGVQLAARVVLPRTLNPVTARPFELLIRSAQLGLGGDWEDLALDHLPQRLANHARVARAQYGSALDEREAFVSHLVFLTPGGRGATELLVDQIQLFGLASNSRGGRTQSQNALEVTAPSTRDMADTNRGLSANSGQRFARLPRIIQWQGESFEALQKMGFNTIGMSRLPAAKQLQQADQLGLRLVCPPPSPPQLSLVGIGAEYAPVLAWDLGEQLSAADLAQANQWQQLVARKDPLEERPTVSAPQLHTLEASRVSDILLLGRASVGTELTAGQHATWLAQRQRLARPGTPIWTQIETDLSGHHQGQAAAFGAVTTTTYGQLTALISASLGVKTRGFYFRSQAPLTAQNASSQRRALNLELTNLRLQLAEPWLMTGKETIPARSSQPELSALVMQAERSHLLVPVWWSGNMQQTNPPRQAAAVSFVVPGVAESSTAYLVTLAGLQRVRHQRVTGGVRVVLEALPYDSFLLFSEDQRAVSQVARYLRRIAKRATSIRRELAKLRLEASHELLASLPGTTLADQAAWRHAQEKLTECDQQLQASHFELAYQSADAVELALEQLASELKSRFSSPSLQSLQLHVGPISLPDQLRLNRWLARAPLGENLLTGGGFENLTALLESGWRHQQLPLEGITSSVRLSPEAPHSGSYCLELEARALDTHSPATIVPTSPVWIASTPLPVRAGDLLEITGVARLPASLIGSVDGLQIIDSLGGPEMALRIHEAPSWQPFRVIRAATGDTQLSVTIALSGLGKAQVDDVAVRVIRK